LIAPPIPITSSGRPHLAPLIEGRATGGVDIGEGHDLGLAVVPAPAAEQADVVGQRLFEVEDVAVFDAALRVCAMSRLSAGLFSVSR
jgi:hypothetical protein